jgi:hypothetical protein
VYPSSGYFSDGLIDPFSAYTRERLERTVSGSRDRNATEICEAILKDRSGTAEQTDDLSMVVIKYV